MPQNDQSRAYQQRMADPNRQRRDIAPDLLEFFEYLRNFSMADLWPPRERSDVIKKLYLVLRLCIFDGSDYVTIGKLAITWDMDGQSGGYMSLLGLETPTCRELMRRMRQRDPMVRRHLGVISESTEAITYRIANDPANLASDEVLLASE